MGQALVELEASEDLFPPERRERERPDLGLLASFGAALSDVDAGLDEEDALGLEGRRRREDPLPRDLRPSPEDS